MKTSIASIPVGTSSMHAYYAVPDGGPAPAVIVLQEIFGINAEMKRITELLASAGYAGLAINYYHRTAADFELPYTQEGLQQGYRIAEGITRSTLFEDLQASVRWLNEQPEVAAGRIATWGFCMGGSVAFLSATLPEIKAAVSFYGGSIVKPFPNGDPGALADVAALQAPLLLAFGGQDEYIPADARTHIERALHEAGKDFDLKVYENESHGFFRQSSKAFDNANVKDAWERVQAFLRRV